MGRGERPTGQAEKPEQPQLPTELLLLRQEISTMGFSPKIANTIFTIAAGEVNPAYLSALGITEQRFSNLQQRITGIVEIEEAVRVAALSLRLSKLQEERQQLSPDVGIKGRGLISPKKKKAKVYIETNAEKGDEEKKNKPELIDHPQVSTEDVSHETKESLSREQRFSAGELVLMTELLSEMEAFHKRFPNTTFDIKAWASDHALSPVQAYSFYMELQRGVKNLPRINYRIALRSE